MAGRHPARFLAPLALLGFALALFLIVTGDRSSAPSATGTEEARPAGERETRRATRSGGRRTYTVAAGDTLSSIAERFDVPTTQIEELNPRVDPQLLAPGTRLRLRR
jgi:LysM repeat protein